MIEIDLNSLSKQEKHYEYVTVHPKKGKPFKRKQLVGRKKEEKSKSHKRKIPILKDMNIESRMKKIFGEEVVSEYKNKLTNMDESELHNEFKSIIKDKTFRREVFGEWAYKMDEIDGWITDLFDLDKKNSKWRWNFKGEPSSHGDKESLMKSILVNQEYLRRIHPSGYITLYRGMGAKSYDEVVEKGMKVGDTFQMRSYNLSSWSEYPEVADAYASLMKRGIVAEVKVPIGNILWSTRIVGRILHENNSPDQRVNDGQEYAIIGGGYLPISIHSLKLYKEEMSVDEYDKVMMAIRKREGLI